MSAADAAETVRAAPNGRRSLDRDLIVGAAVRFIDAHGQQGLTMRRLGGMLGVEAMALYRYVSGKEDLLAAVVEHLVTDMRVEAVARPGAPPAGMAWQAFLRHLAHAVRGVALEHPRAFSLVVSRPAEAPWLRPPLRSLDWVEDFLSRLGREGFSDEAAVVAYRGFTSFLLGHLLLEAAMRGAGLSPLDALDDRAGGVGAERDDSDGLAGHPTLRQLRGSLSLDRAAEEFEAALEDLLTRLEVRRVENVGR